MNALVATSHYRSPEHRDSEVVSPELVLVDPVLAASARQRLQGVAGSPSSAQPSTPSFGALVALATAALEAADEPVSPSTGPRSRSWSVVAGAAATVTVLLLLDVRVQVGRTPASAETTAIGKPPAAQQSVGPTVPRSTGRPERAAAPRPRRFVWAPTADASGYHVELFRGSSMVFSADTAGPQVTIPARWSHGGQRRSLTSGEYRWYVWPVVEVSGQRASRAIVQAKLVVP